MIDADSITDRKTHRNGLFFGEGGSQIKKNKLRGGGVQKLPKTYGLHFFIIIFSFFLGNLGTWELGNLGI